MTAQAMRTHGKTRAHRRISVFESISFDRKTAIISVMSESSGFRYKKPQEFAAPAVLFLPKEKREPDESDSRFSSRHVFSVVCSPP